MLKGWDCRGWPRPQHAFASSGLRRAKSWERAGVQTSKTTTTSASRKQTKEGKPKHQLNRLQQAINAWLTHLTSQKETRQTENELATALDSLLREYLPTDSLSNPIQGREPEVRQASLELLRFRYLKGNKQLVRAVIKLNTRGVRKYFEIAVRGAIKSASDTLAQQTNRRRETPLDLVVHSDIPTVNPKRTARNFSELPVALQMQVVLTGLRKGVTEGKVSAKTVAIVEEILERDITVTEIAEGLKVTPQAVSQRLKRIRPYIDQHIETAEFPG